LETGAIPFFVAGVLHRTLFLRCIILVKYVSANILSCEFLRPTLNRIWGIYFLFICRLCEC